MTPDGHPRRPIVMGLAAGLATLCILLATEPKLAIVWDEGYTLGREARLRTWFSALRDPAGFAAHWKPPAMELVQQVGAPPPPPERINNRSKLLFDREVLAYFWPFAREEPHGHPPFYALVGLAGDLLVPSWQELPRARLGPMLLFSVAGGVLTGWSARRWGVWPGLTVWGAWTLQPNLFGHAHYATYDAILSSLWAVAIITYSRSLEPGGEGQHPTRRVGRVWAAAFGVVLGCAMATKLTGWFLPIPFAAWALATRSWRAFRVLALGVPVAAVVLFALDPPWWTEPVAGLERFFRSNLSRGDTIPIPVQFLGKIYQTPRESLPWYNTLVWTVLVTPVGFLVLAMIGAVAAVRRRTVEPAGLLIMANWLFLLALRALPHTPGHDGVRLFLPAFGVLSLMAGLGAWQVIVSLGAWGRGLPAAALVEAVVSLWLIMPVPLAYYSPIVVGLPGAARLGMEPTYYWDALDANARRWLREHTGSGETIVFSTFPTAWLYLREVGELPRRIAPLDSGRPAWYVLQNRPGALNPRDRAILSATQPAYKVEKFGVPLLWIVRWSEPAGGR